MGTVFFQRQVSLASLVITLVASDNSSAAQTGRSSASSSAPITVVIDAGHGGHDRGGIPGQSVAEKEMTLDVAQRLRNVLARSEEHTSELQSQSNLVCRLLLEKK